jgi:hypothetical protein
LGGEQRGLDNISKSQDAEHVEDAEDAEDAGDAEDTENAEDTVLGQYDRLDDAVILVDAQQQRPASREQRQKFIVSLGAMVVPFLPLGPFLYP